MASNSPVLPAPPLNFGQFSRPVADAKALLRMAAFGQRVWLNDAHLNPNGVAPEVIVSALSWTDSNGGLAHQRPQMSTPIRQELPCLPPSLGGAAAAHNSLSARCPEKTHDESAVLPLPAELGSSLRCVACLKKNLRFMDSNVIFAHHHCPQMLPSAEKEIPCPHKGYKDTLAPLNSSSADSSYHSELKIHNEFAIDPLTVILPTIGKELPCLHESLKDVIMPLSSSSTNSANFSKKTHNESVMHPLTVEIDPDADAEKCSLGHNAGSSLKRARAPELHSKSERRRIDKMNKKMRALQKLIPNAGKIDKSSILDKAIEYLKYLQFQIQFRSMQSGMDPRPLMLLTGMQEPKAYHQLPYLQQMGMSTGLMGMGFGTSIGLPLSHMATVQIIPGQRVPSSQQLHTNSLINATNGSDGIQYLADNTTYGTHFPH